MKVEDVKYLPSWGVLPSEEGALVLKAGSVAGSLGRDGVDHAIRSSKTFLALYLSHTSLIMA